MLGDPKLLDLLEFRVPIKWQKFMVMHGLDPSKGTIKEFTEFCERLERTGEEHEEKIPEKKKLANFKDRINLKDRQDKKPEKQKGRSSHNTKFHCLIYGENLSHNSNDCFNLKKEAEKHRNIRSNKGKKFQKKLTGLVNKFTPC